MPETDPTSNEQSYRDPTNPHAGAFIDLLTTLDEIPAESRHARGVLSVVIRAGVAAGTVRHKVGEIDVQADFFDTARELVVEHGSHLAAASDLAEIYFPDAQRLIANGLQGRPLTKALRRMDYGYPNPPRG